jgi:hypothetical protein
VGEVIRASGVGLAALALVAALAGAVPAHADAGPHVIPIDRAALDDPDALAPLYDFDPSPHADDDPTLNARCGDPAPDPVPDGEPIVVTIPPAAPFTVGAIPAGYWKKPPVTDPAWRLTFRGLMWMKPLARRAAIDGQTGSLAALVAQAVAFQQQNPDAGTNDNGWDEGTSLRRLETENCLYSLTHAAALVPGMTMDANVLLGSRYYGPPFHPVHNHGLMANLQLVRAADRLGKPAWKTKAVSRMISEAPQAFSKAGIAYEQSSQYQTVNASLWNQGANLLEQTPGTMAPAAAIRRTVTAAYLAYAWMTEPDGGIVQIGDAEQAAGLPVDLGAARVLRDDQTGWVIGRWSWTDPATPYYTIRYGPSRRAHGHNDQAGAVTWSADGVRVLVGPGMFSYDTASNYLAYQRGPQGQNGAVPDKGKPGSGSGAVSASRIRAATHNWTVRDTVFGQVHTRGVTVGRDAPSLVVADTFAKAALWRQSWHLDPQWTLVSAGANSTTLVFQHPSGSRLTVVTTGRVSSVLKGVTRPPAGWHFPAYGSRGPALEFTIRSYGKLCRTTFSVS